MKTSDALSVGAIVLFMLAVIAGSIYVEFRNYAECRATPHTMFYCLSGHR